MTEPKPAADPATVSAAKTTGMADLAATMSQAKVSIETSLAVKFPGSSAGPASVAALSGNFGRYKIKCVLGKGAMGVVYLAEDTTIGRQVALKIPKTSILEEQDALERFYREARTTATLRHNNICPVYDVGCIDGIHYLAMAYIPGKPISSFLSTGKLPAARQVALLIRKLALALEEAHRQGIVHRDLKPANVMLDDRNEPIVMDFGLARNINTAENARLTQSGAILGTPAYMSPEQVRGEVDRIGPPCDIYALGVMMYQFLTGDLPFAGPLLLVFSKIISETPQRPSELRPDVDPTLDAICWKMMAKEIEQRFVTMKEVADTLTEYLKTGMVAKLEAVDTYFAAAAAIEAEPDWGNFPELQELEAAAERRRAKRREISSQPTPPEQGWTWLRRQPWFWAAAGSVAALPLVLLLAALIWIGRNRPSSPPEVIAQLPVEPVPATQSVVPIDNSDLLPLDTVLSPFPAISPRSSIGADDKRDPQAENVADFADENSAKITGLDDDPNANTGGWIHLFNGKNLDGWMQLNSPLIADNPDIVAAVTDWIVTPAGTLKCLGQSHGCLRTVREYGSCELACQLKLSPKGDSGLFLPWPETVGRRNPGTGFETQLAAASAPATTFGGQGSGKIFSGKYRPPGEWNDILVRFEPGRLIRVTLNGTVTSEIDLTEARFSRTLRKGYIGLQDWQKQAKDCEYRHIRIRELTPADREESMPSSLTSIKWGTDSVVLKTGLLGEEEWLVTFAKPGQGWMMPDYDASKWQKRKSPFGAGWTSTPYELKDSFNRRRWKAKTKWDSLEIWLRKEVELPDEIASARIQWSILNDEDVKIYVNGELEIDRKGWNTWYQGEAKEPGYSRLKPGKNLIAVYCENRDDGIKNRNVRGGPGAIDVGLSWQLPVR